MEWILVARGYSAIKLWNAANPTYGDKATTIPEEPELKAET
jgi:hypothetical protein